MERAIYDALSLGCSAFALFIRNQRKWESPPMDEGALEKWNRAIMVRSIVMKVREREQIESEIER